MSRRRRGRWRRAGSAAVALLALLAVWTVLAPASREDRTAKCRDLVAAIETAASRRGLTTDEPASCEETRTAEGIRWELADRAWLVPPPVTPRAAAGALRRAARSAGLLVREEVGAGDRILLEAAFPDGRPVLRAVLRPKRWIALIIDDLGYSLETARRVAALPCRLTCAIIPGTKFAREAAIMARRRGHEVMLHLPMASPFASPDVPEYVTMLRHGMTRDEVRDRLARALRDVPGVTVVNNHEGSSATADADLMANLMLSLKPLGLGFVDSGTVATTVAWRVARDAGLRWGRRDVFLDADRSPAAIDAAFDRALRAARRRGTAIVIGHHHVPATLAMLERRIPVARSQGYDFIRATAALRGG